jgi:4-nitrophenyl phosphatase
MSIHFSSIRAVILDMDGVLWRGTEVLPGIAEFFAFVRRHRIAFALATNNSTKTVDAYVERLNSVGVPAGPQNVVTSAVATAEYIRCHYPGGTPVYVIGGEGIHHALAEQGYPDNPEKAQLVVVGMDPALTYEKLKIATLRIRAGAHFIGTNGDLTFPLPEGLAPGNGATLAALQAATGVAPLVIGKPERAMFEVALQRLGTSPEQTLMVGDRLETDIAGAQRAGLPTTLVLTGITTREQATISEIQADGVFESLPALCGVWAECLESESVV